MTPLSIRSHVLLAVAAACIGAPAHASIVVASYANCLEGGTLVNRSWTSQYPNLSEWSFALTQTNYTQDGLRTVAGSQVAPGRVTAEFRFAPSYRVSLVVANHWAFDGHAYYGVTTSATSCANPDVKVYEVPQRISAVGTAGGGLAGNAQFVPTLALPAPATTRSQPGVRIDSAANVLPAEHLERSKLQWEQSAAQATVTAVEQMLADASQARLGRAAARQHAALAERLTFAEARVGSTSLAKLTPAVSLPAGNNLASGWTGLTRIYRIGPSSWVMLEEMDLDAMQASVVILRESINSEVNGSPALLRSTGEAHDPSLTALTWIANGKRYSLKTNLPANQAGERLLAIARGMY